MLGVKFVGGTPFEVPYEGYVLVMGDASPTNLGDGTSIVSSGAKTAYDLEELSLIRRYDDDAWFVDDASDEWKEYALMLWTAYGQKYLDQKSSFEFLEDLEKLSKTTDPKYNLTEAIPYNDDVTNTVMGNPRSAVLELIDQVGWVQAPNAEIVKKKKIDIQFSLGDLTFSGSNPLVIPVVLAQDSTDPSSEKTSEPPRIPTGGFVERRAATADSYHSSGVWYDLKRNTIVTGPLSPSTALVRMPGGARGSSIYPIIPDGIALAQHVYLEAQSSIVQMVGPAGIQGIYTNPNWIYLSTYGADGVTFGSDGKTYRYGKEWTVADAHGALAQLQDKSKDYVAQFSSTKEAYLNFLTPAGQAQYFEMVGLGEGVTIGDVVPGLKGVTWPSTVAEAESWFGASETTIQSWGWSSERRKNTSEGVIFAARILNVVDNAQLAMTPGTEYANYYASRLYSNQRFDPYNPSRPAIPGVTLQYSGLTTITQATNNPKIGGFPLIKMDYEKATEISYQSFALGLTTMTTGSGTGFKIDPDGTFVSYETSTILSGSGGMRFNGMDIGVYALLSAYDKYVKHGADPPPGFFDATLPLIAEGNPGLAQAIKSRVDSTGDSKRSVIAALEVIGNTKDANGLALTYSANWVTDPLSQLPGMEADIYGTRSARYTYYAPAQSARWDLVWTMNWYKDPVTGEVQGDGMPTRVSTYYSDWKAFPNESGMPVINARLREGLESVFGFAPWALDVTFAGQSDKLKFKTYEESLAFGVSWDSWSDAEKLQYLYGGGPAIFDPPSEISTTESDFVDGNSVIEVDPTTGESTLRLYVYDNMEPVVLAPDNWDPPEDFANPVSEIIMFDADGSQNNAYSYLAGRFGEKPLATTIVYDWQTRSFVSAPSIASGTNANFEKAYLTATGKNGESALLTTAYWTVTGRGLDAKTGQITYILTPTPRGWEQINSQVGLGGELGAMVPGVNVPGSWLRQTYTYSEASATGIGSWVMPGIELIEGVSAIIPAWFSTPYIPLGSYSVYLHPLWLVALILASFIVLTVWRERKGL